MNIKFEKAMPVWEKDHESVMNETLVFRYVMEAETKSILRITGSSIYNIVINGGFVASGPARCAHGYYRVDEIKLDEFLTEEKNVVAIYVAGYNVNSFYTLDQPAFLCAEIETDGNVVAHTGNEGNICAYKFNERVRKVQRYSYQRDFTEVYRLSEKFSELENNADYNYEKVELSEQDTKNYLSRNIFYPKYERCYLNKFISAGTVEVVNDLPRVYQDRSLYEISKRFKGYEIDDLEVISTDVAQSLVLNFQKNINTSENFYKLSDKEYVTADFGRVLSGLLEFNIKCHKKTKVVVLFDEMLSDDGLINYTRQKTANVIIWELEEGNYDLRSFSSYTMRFTSFIILGEADIENVKIIEFAYNKIKYKYSGGNEKLNLIYDAAIETFRQNTFDLYMDCPSRERAGWLCDSFFTSRVEYLLTGKSEVEYNFLENFILPDRFKFIADGMFPMCYPADHYDGKFIPNWAMWYVLQMHEYITERNGDRNLLLSAKDKIYKLCKYFEKFENELGLLENLESWLFVEWSSANRLVQDVNMPTNMLYAFMLEKLGELFDDKEKVVKGEKLKSVINSMAMHNGFYCDNAVRNKENNKLYISGECSEVCQYYAFFTGTATPETKPELWKILVDDFGPERKITQKWKNIYFANAFVGNYLRLDILHRYGYKEKVLENIEGYFYGMAEKTGTLWEYDTPAASMCHGFASHVLVWLR